MLEMMCAKRTRDEDFLDLQKKIKYGWDVDEADRLGWTPLRSAVCNNDFALTKYLISKGANVNFQEIYKKPILHHAKTVEMVEYLIECGANVNLCDFYGMNLLGSAIENGKDLKIVDCLITHGADLNVVDNFGCTAFDYAVRCGENAVEICKILVRYGANFDLGHRCYDGRSNLEYIQASIQDSSFVENLHELAAKFNYYYSCFVEGKFEEFFKADGLTRYNIYKRHYEDLPLTKRFCDFLNQKFDKNGVYDDDREFKIDHPSLNLPVDIIKQEINSVFPGYGDKFVTDMHNHIWNKNVVNSKFICDSESKVAVFNNSDLTSLIMDFVGPCEEIEHVTEGLPLLGDGFSTPES